MRIETIPIEKCKNWEKNPRKVQEKDFEMLKRQCCMMEIDEKYRSIIISRYEQFTGEKHVC